MKEELFCTEELSTFLKECNLIFTNTIDRNDFCKVNFDIDKEKANFDNCINIFELVHSFNKLYNSFKKEYEKIGRINFGEKTEILHFNKIDENNHNYRNLCLYIHNPLIIKYPYTYLYLIEMDGIIKSYVTNNLSPVDKRYYCEEINLDAKSVKKYLNLFEKYRLLLDFYKYLKSNQIFGDGTFSIFTEIDDHNCNLLEELNKFRVSFGSSYFNEENYIDIVFNLGDKLQLDYPNCRYIINHHLMSLDEKEYQKILKNTYINKKYTKEVDKNIN